MSGVLGTEFAEYVFVIPEVAMEPHNPDRQ